jgi:hypothetical protein
MMTVVTFMLMYSIYLGTKDLIEDESTIKFFNVFWIVAFAALFIINMFHGL